MRLAGEFREFITRGNVIDLAVGVLIGAAFGKTSPAWSTRRSCRPSACCRAI